MLAIQRVGHSDNFAPKKKARRRLRHLVTRSGHRELWLSKLMRPAEIVVVALLPLFLFAALAGRCRLRLRSATGRRRPA